MRMLKYKHNGEVIVAIDSWQDPRICPLSSSIHCQVSILKLTFIHFGLNISSFVSLFYDIS